MPRTIVCKRQNTVALPANDLLTVEMAVAGEFALSNFGPGNLWVSWSPGVIAAVGNEAVTLLKANTAYASTRVRGYQPNQVTMIADGPTTITFTVG